MILCPSAPLPLPPPPSLSSKASAAHVVFVAVPRATRTMQRFVMGEKYFTFCFRVNKKKGGIKGQNIGGERRRKGIEDFSPASEVPTSPQPASPKFESTLCFSALKTSLLDIASSGGVIIGWIWPFPGAGTDVDDDDGGGGGGGEAGGMNSMRSQRFCLSVRSIARRNSVGQENRTLNRTMGG